MKALYLDKATDGIEYNSIYMLKTSEVVIVVVLSHDRSDITLSVFEKDDVVSDRQLMNRGAINISDAPEHLRNFIILTFISRIIKS